MPVRQSPLRVGLVGAGMISQMHVPAFRDFPEAIALAAVCDVREQAARKVASEARCPAVFTDFEEMLASDSIDAVDICTPHDLHAPQAIAAARAGKHVFVEKPMACSVEECRQMVAAAEDAGVTLMVGQTLRYLPGNLGVRKLIGSGALGRVWWARADSWFPVVGLPGSGYEWSRDPERSGGGVLHMLGTHHVDLLRFYLGNVATVRAHCFTNDPNDRDGTEDRAVATLEFESGAVAQLTACYLPYRTPHHFQYTIFGDAGGIYSTLPEAPEWYVTAGQQHHAPSVVSSVRLGSAGELAAVPPVEDGMVSPQPWVNELSHFAECVRTGAEPMSSGRDNLATMKVVYGCYESARTGRAIKLSEQP